MYIQTIILAHAFVDYMTWKLKEVAKKKGGGTRVEVISLDTYLPYSGDFHNCTETIYYGVS